MEQLIPQSMFRIGVVEMLPQHALQELNSF